MSLKWEVGRKYKRRDGKVVTLTETHPHNEIHIHVFDDNETRSRKGYVNAYMLHRSDRDIIDYYTEENTVSKVNAQRVETIINELPICDNGKRKVRELVQELQPELKLSVEMAAGQIWRHRQIKDSSGLRLVVMDENVNNEWRLVALDSNHLIGSGAHRISQSEGEYQFVANSLAEYIANGGKL